MTIGIKAGIIAAALAVLIGGYFVWRGSERKTGAARIQNADISASAVAVAVAQAKTDDLLKAATEAAQVASHAQLALKQYVSDYPLPIIRLCSATTNPGHPRLPEAGAPVASGTAGTPGAGDVAAMLNGGVRTSGDISPELRTLVQSAGSLSIGLREAQSRAAFAVDRP